MGCIHPPLSPLGQTLTNPTTHEQFNLTGDLLTFRVDFQAPATSSQVVALVELHDTEITSAAPPPPPVVEPEVFEPPPAAPPPAATNRKLSSMRNTSPPRSRRNREAPKLSIGKTSPGRQRQRAPLSSTIGSLQYSVNPKGLA